MKIDKSKVMKAYSGRPGCMCGCNGTYYVAAAHIEAAGKWRGYPYDEDDINDGMITKICNILDADPAANVTGEHVFLSTGKRYYAVYFVKDTK